MKQQRFTEANVDRKARHLSTERQDTYPIKYAQGCHESADSHEVLSRLVLARFARKHSFATHGAELNLKQFL